jgi:hypothetical protein
MGGWDSVVSIATLYVLGGTDSSPGGRQSRPDRPWRPASLLYNGDRGSLPGVKQPGRGVDHPLSSSAEVMNEWSWTCTPLSRLHGILCGTLYLHLLLQIYTIRKYDLCYFLELQDVLFTVNNNYLVSPWSYMIDLFLWEHNKQKHLGSVHVSCCSIGSDVCLQDADSSTSSVLVAMHSQTNFHTPVPYDTLRTLTNLCRITSQAMAVNCDVTTQLSTAISKAYSLIFTAAAPNEKTLSEYMHLDKETSFYTCNCGSVSDYWL